jgi:VWFA-related protein
MQNWPLPFLAVLATLAVAFPARVAAGPAAGEITSVDTTQYPLVTLSVPIVDEAGNAVTGLTAENFTIQQDGKEATIESVDAAIDTDIGAGVVVVIDISGSMAGPPIEAAKAAAISFVGSLSPSDLVAVVAFSDSVQLVQPFTADKAATTAVIQGLNVFGDTALFEAANQSLDFALQSGLSRQAVVLLSDGANDDPDGGPAPDLVLARASKMGIPIFAVALGAAADATFTQQLADVSGGVAYRANSPAELSGLYGAMAERLNSEYIVRYQAPPGVGEQTITVVAEAGGNTYTAEAALDVLWSATSEEGGPTVRLPEFKPGSTVDRDLVMSPIIESSTPLTGVTAFVDGGSRQALTEPYEFTLEPAALSIGRHVVAFEARDQTGAVGLFEVVVEIPAVQPKLVTTPAAGAALQPGDPIAIDVLAQGMAADSVVVTVDGEDFELSEPPFVFEVPRGLEEGSQEITIAAEVEGQRLTSSYEFELVPKTSSGNFAVYAAGGVLGLVALSGGYVLLRRRRRQRQLRREQTYVPGMRDGLEPLVAAPAAGGRESSESRGLRARLRATNGPLAGRIFFLGNGSGVIGTSPDATIQIDLSGWETAPELVRIWSRDDKYMFHQVAPGNVTVSGREARWAVLESGDEIRIDQHTFVFEIPSAAPDVAPLPAGSPA